MHNFIICNTQKEANRYASCYGNTHFTITKEEIEALLVGKILVGDVAGEYSVFIEMEEQ